MRKEKALIRLLQGLVKLLAEEASQNLEFASKLNSLLSEVPEKKIASKKPTAISPQVPLPDIHAEWSIRGETDFRLWLRDIPIPLLRMIISSQDFDATRRTTKWKEAEKLADFITDSLRARRQRGQAFMRRTP